MAPTDAGAESNGHHSEAALPKELAYRSYSEVLTGQPAKEIFEEWPVTERWSDQHDEDFDNHSESECGGNEWSDTKGKDQDSGSNWRNGKTDWSSDSKWGASSRGESHRRQKDVEGVRRTICWFWQQGTCKKMNGQCCFAHGEEEIGTVAPINNEEESPDQVVRRTLCKFWLQGNCEKASGQCGFAHGEEEIGTRAPAETKSICRFYVAGYCRSGTSCPFIHSADVAPASKANDIPEPQKRSGEATRKRRFDVSSKAKSATGYWSAPVVSEMPAGSDLGSDVGSVTGTTTIDTPLASVASELPASSADETGSSTTPPKDSKRKLKTHGTFQERTTSELPSASVASEVDSTACPSASASVASEVDSTRRLDTNVKAKTKAAFSTPLAPVASEVIASRSLDTMGKVKSKGSCDTPTASVTKAKAKKGKSSCSIPAAPVVAKVEVQLEEPSCETSSASVAEEVDLQQASPKERHAVKPPEKNKRAEDQHDGAAKKREAEPQVKKAKSSNKSSKKSKGKARTAEETATLVNVSLLFLATFMVTILSCILVRCVQQNTIDARQIIAGLGWCLVLVAAPAAYLFTSGTLRIDS